MDGHLGLRTLALRKRGRRLGSARSELRGQEAMYIGRRRLDLSEVTHGHSSSVGQTSVRRISVRDEHDSSIQRSSNRVVEQSSRQSRTAPRRGGDSCRRQATEAHQAKGESEGWGQGGSLEHVDMHAGGRVHRGQFGFSPDLHITTNQFSGCRRFYAHLRLKSLHSIGTPLGDPSSRPLFASGIPFPDMESYDTVNITSRRRHARFLNERRARRWLNALFGHFTYIHVGGAPKRVGDYSRIGSCVADPRVVAAATSMMPLTRTFCSLSRSFPQSPEGSDSRATIITHLNNLASSKYHQNLEGNNIESLIPAAQWVDDRNCALPDTVGGVRPADYLLASERAVLLDLEANVKLPSNEWGNLPKACLKIRPSRKRQFYQKLLRSGLCVLLPYRDIPTDPITGLPIVGGFFGVGKKGKVELRLSFDRRPQNATERRLRWGVLPQASQLRHIILKRRESLIGDGDDLSVYFYRLDHEADWYKHNAVGGIIDG